MWTVPVDKAGRMDPSALRGMVVRAKSEGRTPLYVNATAGTTVLGSYDPFEAIAAVCREFGLWMHIDASWGGPAIFSARHRGKLAGSHLADSLTVNPHKMLNVPVTCSFLLGPDMAVFHRANTLPAGYLFHATAPAAETTTTTTTTTNGITKTAPPPPALSLENMTAAGGGGGETPEVWDLADLTLQCGRRADSLKLALSWIYHGAAGFARQVDAAFDAAAYLADLLAARPDEFVLVSERPPPCLQVCFYYAGGGNRGGLPDDPAVNTARTRAMVERLVARGFMVDYAPGERGCFFRVVVNCQTLRGTVEGLVKALVAVGKEVVG